MTKFIGWDVGGWNCDSNRKSRDALVVLDRTAQCVGQPFRGNLRETINGACSSADFLSALLRLCEIDVSAQPEHAVIAIDAPLGFPEAFTRLVTCRKPVGPIGDQSVTNPYLFRKTERRLVNEKMPLSAIKDMIGSQSTKAMHVVARFAPELETCGVWTDHDRRLTVIETYPGLCRARSAPQQRQAPSGSLNIRGGRDADLRDARVCAEVARDFTLHRERLEGPPASSPKSEGWIWAPRPGL